MLENQGLEQESCEDDGKGPDAEQDTRDTDEAEVDRSPRQGEVDE